ncbi:NAD(P)-binding protein [Tothia fuscella]|uniref:NAD(P)-binding protein n=1 Tax=Tothia fuscella TaxID=1048955 RepID=A0A9P4NGL1_9PEZI|nr:NAD(P)-binding protein [Tothia fuscella]
MTTARKLIALAGAGDLGKYACEELLRDERFDLAVLSRKRDPWFLERNIDIHETDYSEKSVLQILNETNATALISFISVPHQLYLEIHVSLLGACRKSISCKRFIPSEFAGNIDNFPLLPKWYGASREPFRRILGASSGVEWTLVNFGWIMDYVLPKEKTYMTPIPDLFPIDPNGWKACIRGTGDEPQSFTCGRNIGEALVELLAAPKWEIHTYITGDRKTFNEVAEIVEKHFGRQLPKTFKSSREIKDFLKEHLQETNSETWLTEVEEWMIEGASSCPHGKVLDHMEKYFGRVNFLSIEALLELAKAQV